MAADWRLSRACVPCLFRSDMSLLCWPCDHQAEFPKFEAVQVEQMSCTVDGVFLALLGQLLRWFTMVWLDSAGSLAGHETGNKDHRQVVLSHTAILKHPWVLCCFQVGFDAVLLAATCLDNETQQSVACAKP